MVDLNLAVKICTCWFVHKELKLSDRMWTCPQCGSVNDRDLLAANNIKRFAFCKNNTAVTAGINACVDLNHIVDSDQEALSFMGV